MATTIFDIIQYIPPCREIHSTVEGKVRITLIEKGIEGSYPIHTSGGGCYTRNGQYLDKEGCECNLFPSRDCRDWNRWAEVLVKDSDIVLHKSGRVVRFDHRSMDFDDIVRFASMAEEAEQNKNDAVERTENEEKPKKVRIFLPFDKVLVADHKTQRLIPRLFSCIQGNLFYCQDGHGYKYCIPYEGNEATQYINN